MLFLATGFGHWSCAIVGCRNSGKKLNKWSSSMCKVHKCIHEKDGCDCEPPFQLFAFPTERKNNEARTRWAKAINRPNPNGKMWMPKKSSSVCSDHRKSENPDPELNFGYKKVLKLKRKLPAVRLEIPTKVIRILWKLDL